KLFEDMHQVQHKLPMNLLKIILLITNNLQLQKQIIHC
ncbi:hypothetical protein CP02DC14_2316, partial [Chlamydia psittaci 02DC14]